MAIQFWKYHGLGNDYLVIDPSKSEVTLSPDSIRLICDRHTGVGSDGILYGPFQDSDMPRLQIFNPDGSEAEKSGNGLRIFARYLFEQKYIDTRTFQIQTLGGLVTARIQDKDGHLITIDMGRVTFQSSEIPVAGTEREVVGETLALENRQLKVTCLSIGNPHCVIPLEKISETLACELGPQVENHSQFPNRINMQLLKVVDRHTIDIRIWERGAGYTLASGSSSCAAACAALRLGYVNSPVTVRMPGGKLNIEIDESGLVTMTGPVAGISQGTLHTDLEKAIHD